jgi:hypothetical protein
MANRQRQAIDAGLQYVYELYTNPSNSAIVSYDYITRLVQDDGTINDLYIDTPRGAEVGKMGLVEHVGQIDSMDVDSNLPLLLLDEDCGDFSSVPSLSPTSGSSADSSQLLLTPLSWSPVDHPPPSQYGFFAVLPPRPQSFQHIRDIRQVFDCDDSDEEMDGICDQLRRL